MDVVTDGEVNFSMPDQQIAISHYQGEFLAVGRPEQINVIVLCVAVDYDAGAVGCIPEIQLSIIIDSGDSSAVRRPACFCHAYTGRCREDEKRCSGCETPHSQAGTIRRTIVKNEMVAIWRP